MTFHLSSRAPATAIPDAISRLRFFHLLMKPWIPMAATCCLANRWNACAAWKFRQVLCKRTATATSRVYCAMPIRRGLQVQT